MNWLIAGCHCCTGIIFHIFGGLVSGTGAVQDNDRYEESNDAWTSQTNLPSPARYYAPATSFSGVAYVFFGTSGSTRLADVDSYVLDTWTSKADGAVAKQQAGVGKVGSYAYVFGGNNGATHYNANEEYDPSGDSWSTKATMPTPTRRTTASQFSLDSGVFQVGGFDLTVYLNDNDKYEPSGDAWTAKTNATFQRGEQAAFSTSSYGYIACGGDGTTVYNDDTTQYDPSGNSWATMSNAGGNYFGSRGIGASTYGYMTGGNKSGTVVTDCSRYNEVSDGWTAKTSTPSPARQLHTSAVMG